MMGKILFVDDDPHLLVASRIFFKNKYPLITATGGQDALMAMRAQGPVAVIVSDLDMPDMTGVELLKTIRDNWPDTVRILHTSKMDCDIADQIMNEIYVFRFLFKPCTPDQLTSAIEAAMEQYRLNANPYNS